MRVETRAGWITAVRQLGQAIGEGGGEVTSDSITDATDIGKQVLTASTDAAARTALGAGTSNLTLGTTASTAKAGNYVPTWGEVTGKPAVIASGDTQAAARAAIGAGTSDLTIGTTASTAKAGNYAPTTDEILDATDVGKSVLTAATAAAARTAIGAGTSNLTIGTTASTAKAGDYTPTTSEVSSALSAKTQIAALTDLGEDAELSDVIDSVNAIIAALKA